MTPQCVNLSVADLDATERWYVTKLGFERVHRKRYDQMSLEIAFLRLGDFEVELIQFQKSTQTNRFPDPPRHAEVRGITHFGLRVKDLDQAMSELCGKGVEVIFGPKEFDELNMKLFFVRDNEGNLLKFVQRLR
jgi:catechol 2,3-dioxygenase-like lactoylglutathione lyase family enzyme